MNASKLAHIPLSPDQGMWATPLIRYNDRMSHFLCPLYSLLLGLHWFAWLSRLSWYALLFGLF